MCYQSLNDQPRPSAVPERRAGPTCLDAQSAPLSLEQAGGASPPLWPRYIGSLANEDWSAVERRLWERAFRLSESTRRSTRVRRPSCIVSAD